GRRRKLVPELPLKGHLLDPDTAQPLYGSASRSCTGARVWYYHGQGRGAYRVRADEVHEAFADLLGEVRLAPRVAELLRAMAVERGASAENERKRWQSAARARLERAEARLLEVDTRFLEGEIDRESHARLLAHYRAERDEARAVRAEAEASVAVEPLHVRYAAAVLERLPDVWRGANPQARDGLVSSIWPAGLTFSSGGFRTTPGTDLIGLLGGMRAENGRAHPRIGSGRPIGCPGWDSNPQDPKAIGF